MSIPALVIAAPSSGAGKTIVSLGIMSALRARGLKVRAAKSGPDYIDPAFHQVATGAPSVNLDAWAMTKSDLRARAIAQGGDILIVEAAMGVLDGGADGAGSAADLAEALGCPMVLVLDIAKVGHSAALPALGLTAARPDISLAGVIFNQAGSDRHISLAKANLGALPFFGAVRRNPDLVLAERHLGLVQACEHLESDVFLKNAAKAVEDAIDINALVAAARPVNSARTRSKKFPPLGQQIAVALDEAFAFIYPHVLADWVSQGSEISFFSPLNDQGPSKHADAVFLPGGYPELHAEKLASNQKFSRGMYQASTRGALIYGECGGYMMLGEALIDANGKSHEMLGLLPVTTSFKDRKMTLGYRKLEALNGPYTGSWKAHEFHYASIVSEGSADPMFAATDATGVELPDMGLVQGNVSGSFAHLISP